MARTTHIVKRESGYIAGWFEQAQVDSGYVAEFIEECNANVPADPAHLEIIPAWPVCEHGVTVPMDCEACPDGEAKGPSWEPAPIDPIAALEQLGAKVSPALTRPGPLVITEFDCVICRVVRPGLGCNCADVEFGSAEYFARLDQVHGRRS